MSGLKKDQERLEIMASTLEVKSPYQLIQLKQHAFYVDEYQLWLDGSFQFSTDVEARYHESLITIPFVAAPAIDRILICGGGDGLAVRDALAFNPSELILCEIDPEMIKLFKDGIGAELNKRSLSDKRVKIEIADATKYVDSLPSNSFDIIVLDFPSPTAKNYKKNYSGLFDISIWDKFIRLLPDHGVISSQVSIPTDILANLIRYLLDQGFMVWHYDTAYNRRGIHDSFLVACKYNMTKRREIPQYSRFASEQHVKIAFSIEQEITRNDLEYYRLFHYCEYQPWEIPQTDEEDYE